MSISDFELKWIKFTKSLRSVGILLIFVMIPFLAFVIIPIHFILTMVSLRDLNNINRELNDPYLNSFRSKYLTASIFKLIGSILVHIGAAISAIVQIINPMIFPYSYGPFSVLVSPSIPIFITGFVIMIIGSGVEIGAWDNLKLFIYYNENLFPERTNFDTTTKLDNLRSGALSWALGFLVITIIIGWILQLVGYFGLSNIAERGTKSGPISTVTQHFQTNSPTTQEPQPVSVIEFCPMCGASVTEGASYCANCGVKIVN